MNGCKRGYVHGRFRGSLIQLHRIIEFLNSHIKSKQKEYADFNQIIEKNQNKVSGHR